MWTDGFGEYPMAVVVADDAEAMLCRPVSPCCISPVWALGDFVRETSAKYLAED